jgi:hypothetical protein
VENVWYSSRDGRLRDPRTRYATCSEVDIAYQVLGDGPTDLRAASPPASAQPAPADPPTIDPVTAAELGTSWRPGCPVGPEQLRRVCVDHIGFDGQTHRGQLIAHEELVSQIITIFEQLYQLGYPIEKIRTVDQYPAASDELPMEDNNTSVFSCRDIPGTGRWSQHAYGGNSSLSVCRDTNRRLAPGSDYHARRPCLSK